MGISPVFVVTNQPGQGMSNLTWAWGEGMGRAPGSLGYRFLKVKCDHNNIMCG